MSDIHCFTPQEYALFAALDEAEAGYIVCANGAAHEIRALAAAHPVVVEALFSAIARLAAFEAARCALGSASAPSLDDILDRHDLLPRNRVATIGHAVKEGLN